MKITLNGESIETAATTIALLLAEQEVGPKVATALNGDFVPAGLRESTTLTAGDRVEILAPMQGG